MKSGENQPDLDFASGSEEGFAQWRASVQPERTPDSLELNFANRSDQLISWRREQAEKLLAVARREGLPIGENVRVVLQSDFELAGRLLLDWETQSLQIGSVNFQKSEIVSCVRV